MKIKEAEMTGSILEGQNKLYLEVARGLMSQLKTKKLKERQRKNLDIGVTSTLMDVHESLISEVVELRTEIEKEVTGYWGFLREAADVINCVEIEVAYAVKQRQERGV